MPYYTLMPMFGASLIIDRSWTQILALYNLLQILGLLCWISLIREVTIDDFVGQLHWFPHMNVGGSSQLVTETPQ